MGATKRTTSVVANSDHTWRATLSKGARLQGRRNKARKGMHRREATRSKHRPGRLPGTKKEALWQF